MCRHPFHVNSDPLCDPAERQSGLRLDDWLPTEFTRIRDVARGTTTEACFIDVEAGALRIFDAIRERFAIGQDGSDLDRVLHLRFAAPRAVWTPTVNFLGAQGWSFFGGTSASAPMVTGTAGILEALGAGSLPISSNYLTASGDPIVTDHSTTSPANSMLAISENVACSGCP